MPVTRIEETKTSSRLTNFVWSRTKDGSDFDIIEVGAHELNGVDCVVNPKMRVCQVNNSLNWVVSKDGKLGLGFEELVGEARKRASAAGNPTKRPRQFRVRFVND